MSRKTLSVFALAALMGATAAHADHNSPFGDDWAQMPTDNHDEAVEEAMDQRSDSSLDNGSMGSEMAADVEELEYIRSGMEDEVTDAAEEAAEAQGEMSEMADEMRSGGMGR